MIKMLYRESKIKTLAMIEELNENNAALTDDPDIAAKYREVCNQVMYELARLKKIPKYMEMEVFEGQIVTMADISAECGYDVYQIGIIAGVDYDSKANGTVFKIRQNGTAEISLFVYPPRITEDNEDDYEFELSPDVLEILPYGIAADLLKSDVSANYGSVYSRRYEEMLQRLDPRNQLGSIYIDGGVRI